jgi:hypothetical protein
MHMHAQSCLPGQDAYRMLMLLSTAVLLGCGGCGCCACGLHWSWADVLNNIASVAKLSHVVFVMFVAGCLCSRGSG